MKRYSQHHPTCSTEFAVAACGGGEFGGRANLRQVLSQLGLRANEAQEEMLLELIHESNNRRQLMNV